MPDRVEQRGFVLPPGDGKLIHYLGGSAVLKITNEQTGSWSFTVETFPAGFASGLHNHPTEDSGFFVLSGTMRVLCGELDATAGPYAFIWLPRGVPHAFKVVSDEPCTWINVQGPTGDFRRFMEEVGAAEPVALSPDELTRTAGAAERHRLERLGPPPF